MHPRDDAALHLQRAQIAPHHPHPAHLAVGGHADLQRDLAPQVGRALERLAQAVGGPGQAGVDPLLDRLLIQAPQRAVDRHPPRPTRPVALLPRHQRGQRLLRLPAHVVVLGTQQQRRQGGLGPEVAQRSEHAGRCAAHGVVRITQRLDQRGHRAAVLAPAESDHRG